MYSQWPDIEVLEMRILQVNINLKRAATYVFSESVNNTPCNLSSFCLYVAHCVW